MSDLILEAMFLVTGHESWKPELQGGGDGSSSTSGRSLTRRVRSEYNSYERTKSASPTSGHESQHTSSISSE